MRNRFISSLYPVCLLSFVVLISCSSTENRTQKRAKERVTQFIHLMSEERIEEAEKLLSGSLAKSETKELFLENQIDWEIRGRTIVINIDNITFHPDDKNMAMVSLTVRSEEIRFTKITTLPLRFERGDWYIGG
ncbi:MAG: hypothetical protein KAW52_02940 [candidate division Zixibacteria bacterium]|nr:hypothetical protein [candidate division Zixibacteria bacterium]